MIRFRDLIWPKTFQGWRTLFWLTLRMCPIHKRSLTSDPWSPSGSILYCFKCDGVGIWPRGLMESVYQNTMTIRREESDASRT